MSAPEAELLHEVVRLREENARLSAELEALRASQPSEADRAAVAWHRLRTAAA